MKRTDQILRDAKVALANREFDRGLCILDQVADSDYLPTRYYLLKSALIQLGDGQKYSLDDAERLLLRAHEIDAENLEVLIDLGFFYSRVSDKPAAAERYFMQAIERLRAFYGSAFGGLLELRQDQRQTVQTTIEVELARLRSEFEARMN